MYKTWIELDKKAARHNFQIFRKLIRSESMIWAVVKSNAYGHGLVHFAKIADSLGVQGFCVDSVIEGLKLRQEGIKKTILVLGPTRNELLNSAAANDITVSVSGWEDFKYFLATETKPRFHVKVDTGMHRQGFMVADLPEFFARLKKNESASAALTGIFSHFASAKDINYPSYTEKQFREFEKAVALARATGFEKIISHISATGGSLLDPQYHLDAVRIGIGLFGYMPSKEFEIQLPEIKLRPVLSWYALISDVKQIKKGEYIGYDLTERVHRDTQVAIIPIGYWHGFAWRLSSKGYTLIGDKRAPILGRVSMDIIAADVTGTTAAAGSKTTLLSAKYNAYDMARRIGTSHYEVLTRINPLIKRIIINGD